jgi:CBS domain-containing protein
MTVKAILDEKGRDVVTVAREATLAEAAETLSSRRIGALVVTDDANAILGILSERDIVRAVAEGGGQALERPVSALMTSKVVRCTEQTTMGELMEMMTDGRFRHVPVEKDGRLSGIVSIGDVVRRRIEDAEREAAEMKAYIAS